MRLWIERILLLAVATLVAFLTATAIPSLNGQPLHGTTLLLHMMASGALVMALPIYALSFLGRGLSRLRSSGLSRLGFWSLLLAGLITIASVFVCMLPIPSTEQMHLLMEVHGYAGFAMVPAVVVLIAGLSRWRRIQSTRSATPG